MHIYAVYENFTEKTKRYEPQYTDISLLLFCCKVLKMKHTIFNFKL